MIIWHGLITSNIYQRKFLQASGFFSKNKKFLTKDHRVQFYKSYIQPHIDFCNIVWGSSSESNKLKIFKLQKRACKVILDFNVNDINEAMKSLKIMSIYERLYLRKAKFMFKIYNHVAPTYISENFTLTNNANTSINLRSASAGCFIPPKPRTEYFKHSMRYSGCLVWNSLSEEIKSAQTIGAFHSRCLKLLFNWIMNDIMNVIISCTIVASNGWSHWKFVVVIVVKKLCNFLYLLTIHVTFDLEHFFYD